MRKHTPLVRGLKKSPQPLGAFPKPLNTSSQALRGLLPPAAFLYIFAEKQTILSWHYQKKNWKRQKSWPGFIT
jgi:hypothetical protein